MNNDRLEPLFRDQCLKLLATQMVGRLGIVEGGAPLILPVNYALDGDEVVFRTDPGTKLAHGVRGSVCFEVDRIDAASESGWSVVIRGRLEEVTNLDDPEFTAHIHSLTVRPWAGGAKAHWMRVVPTAITGRYLPPMFASV